MPLPRPKKRTSEHELPQLCRHRARQGGQRRDRDAGTHHQRRVAAVGVSRQPDLRDESGEEADADEETQLLFAETELVAQIGQEGVDRPVAERQAAADDEVRQERPVGRLLARGRLGHRRTFVLAVELAAVAVRRADPIACSTPSARTAPPPTAQEVAV
jgi:hypothetical protein